MLASHPDTIATVIASGAGHRAVYARPLMVRLLDIVDLRGAPIDEARLRAPAGDRDAALEETVRSILDAVRSRGDEAIRELTRRFDGVDIDEVEVSRAEVAAARATIPGALDDALELAADQIRSYHQRQVGEELDRGPHLRRGVAIEEFIVPVDRVGCYVPGGLAVYPSTVLMTVIPARVAGVGDVTVCVPPGEDGAVPAATLAAADVAGADRVLRIGGAQAIAALAFGTETIAAVDVVVGPGNRYVAEAKRQVVGVVGIDALAGPSEVVVVAGDDAPPDIVAADLLAQAEHGPGGGAIAVVWDEAQVDAIEAALAARLEASDRRDEAASTLAGDGRILIVDDPAAAVAAANAIAPEHLQLMGERAEALADDVRHAGAVFVGADASAVVGDYVAGSNHVLPTGATARFASALRVDAFRKHIHHVRLEAGALAQLAPSLVALTEAEGLGAHRDAVLARLDDGASSR